MNTNQINQTTRIILFLIVALLACACGKDEEEEKKETVADYVILSVSNGEPSFTFPKETMQGYMTSTTSNIQYNSFGQRISFNFHITMPSGNTYNIIVTNIVRNSVGTPTGYKADITATVNSKTISGTLNYP